MRRYWLPAEKISTESVLIDGDHFHHIFDVCRNEMGSKFEILGDRDQAHLVEVTVVEKKKATAKVLESRTLPTPKRPYLSLALSIPRFPVFEAVLEKTVELGIHSVQPFFSDFSFVRSASMWPAQKNQRFEKIVLSATQQSGRGNVMPILPPLSIEALLPQLKQNSRNLIVFAYEGDADQSVQSFLKQQKPENFDHIWLFVGSEGGFSHKEVEIFRQHDLQPVSLGDQVLRVETACIALASILKYELIP